MEARRRRRGKQGRRKQKEFMDAALEAYVRHLALQKWREVTDLQETLGLETALAVAQGGRFPERGIYREVWERWWQRQVMAHLALPVSPLLGCIEAAVQGALDEESGARRQRGDALLEDTPAYKLFLDQALDRLFEEEAGSLEEL